MGHAGTSIRSCLAAGGAIAGAGILALGLVVATPDSHGARTEVRSVQLTSVTLPPSAYLGALEKFIRDRVPGFVPVAPVSKDGAADITTAADSTVDLAADPQQTQATALATTTAGSSPAAILGPLIDNAIVGPFVLIGAFAFALFVIVPVLWVAEVAYEAFAGVFGFLGLPSTLPLSGTAGALAAPAPTLATNAALRDSVPVGTEDVLAPDKKATKKQAEHEQTPADTVESVKDATENGKAEQDSAEPSEASAPEPKVRPNTPRSEVRDSLDASEPQPDRPHHEKGGRHGENANSATADPKSADSSDENSSNGDTGDSN